MKGGKRTSGQVITQTLSESIPGGSEVDTSEENEHKLTKKDTCKSKAQSTFVLWPSSSQYPPYVKNTLKWNPMSPKCLHL